YAHHRDLHSFPTRRSSDLRTTESANSETTSRRRTLLPRPHIALVPAAPRLVPFRVEFKSSREMRKAGERPKRIPEKRESNNVNRSEEHTSELQSPYDLVCR